MKHKKTDAELVNEALAGMKEALDQRDEWIRRATRAELALQIAAREIAQMRLDAAQIPDFPVLTHSMN